VDHPGAGEPRDATPSVLAVVVAHRPGEWFEETLDSIATQDYPRLELMVIDAAGDPELAGRVRATIPRATVLDASDTKGFGAAADAVLDTEADSAFLLICHDDVALAPDAVRVMITESLRSNAGILGPKLVEWDRPDRLQHVGLVVDRFATSAEVIEPAELDQEQFDFVADFSAIPTACMLIRTDLFSRLRGFDPSITFRGDDVDICWRAMLAGARVMVAPDARVRHIEDLIARTGADDVRRTRARHHLRTVLTTASLPSLLITIPLQMILTLGEAVLALVSGSFGQVRDVFGAYGWNLRRSGEIVGRRRDLRSDRRLRFGDLKQTHHRGSVRISAFIRGQIGRGQGSFGSAPSGMAASMRTGTARVSALVAFGAVMFMLFGSRSLITSGVPSVGDFSDFPASAGDMMSHWWSGWRDRDLGSPGSVPSGVALLAGLSWLLRGSTGLVRTLWVIGPLFVGLAGVWRMLRSTGSRRAQTAGMLAFVVVPLPWAALGAGSLGALYAYSVTPWILDGLFRSEGSWPHGAAGTIQRSAVRPALGAGVALGLAALFEPTVVVVLPIVALGLLVGGLVSAHPAGLARLVVGTSVVALVAAALSLPLILDVLGSASSWAIIADGHSGSGSALRLSEILRFAVGPSDPGPLVWLLAIPMALPLLIGRSWRFDLAVKAWMVCLAGWGVALLAASGTLPFGLPDSGVLLAAPAMAVVLLMGLAVLSVEHDLRGAGFGWRQILTPVAVAAAVLSFVPAVGTLPSGRWGLGNGDFERSIPLAPVAASGSYRILWIGAPEFLPISGRPLVGGMAWAATLDGLPTLADRFVPADSGSADLVESTVMRAIDGQTSRLGRDLGGLGVRFIVTIERLQPAPFSSVEDAIEVPSALVEALSSQLDLARIEGTNSSIRVFVNTEWTSVRAALVPGFDEGITALTDLETRLLPGSTGVLVGTGSSVSGPVPGGTEVLVAQTPDPGWDLIVDGRKAIRRPALGWATAFSPDGGGDGVLSYSTPLWRRLALISQLAILIGVGALWTRRKLTGRSL